jgi:DHA1 family bicyclomycin/chloramphenicol resistance-like MFS transporter
MTSAHSHDPERATFSILIPFLGAIAALGPFSNDLYVPSMSIVANAFTVSGAAVQLTMSAVLIGFSFGALIYGPLSDRYGRKNILCLGLAMYAVAAYLAALSPSLPWLVFARAFQGFAAASGMVLSRAIILDRWRGEQASRALSWVSMFMFFAPVIAPLIGGWIAGFERWPAVFWIQGSAGLLGLAVTLFMLPPGGRAATGSVLDSMRFYLPILRDRQAVGYILVSATGFMGVVAFVTTGSFVFVEYFGLSTAGFAVCFSIVMFGGTIGAWVNSHYVARIGISRLLGFGASCLGVSGVATLIAALLDLGVVGLVVPLSVYVLGLGFVFANSVARTLSRFPAAMGAASSIFGVNQFLLGGILAAVLSRADEPSPLPMAITVAVSGISCAAVWWLGLKPHAPLRD